MPSNSPTADAPATEPGGSLYIVATPIGNREDITLRALKVLEAVDLIAAEDTRHTGQLLHHHRIKRPMVSYHEHNEAQRTPWLVEKIRVGQTVALVSDAGTPAVSDPGYRLVEAAVTAGLAVIPIPGVSAVTTALSVAGLPTASFIFLGFLPRRAGRRRQQLKALAGCGRTLICYESPHRVENLLVDILGTLGDCAAVLTREMTKLHEEFLRGQVSQLIANIRQRPGLKGECTLLVSAPASPPAGLPACADPDLSALPIAGRRVSDLAKEIRQRSGLSRRQAYLKARRLLHPDEDVNPDGRNR